MKKERIKSILLIVLVISNIILSSKIWINKKLWPSGYNFFVNIQNSFIVKSVTNLFGRNNSDYISKTHINTPKQIIINTGYQTTRFALDSTYDIFSDANNISQNILSAALSAPIRSISSATQDEWYSVLMSKSVYLNYNVEYDTNLFAQFLGVKETELSSMLNYITDAVLAVDSTSSNITVYIKNGHNDTYYKINTSIAKDDVENLINYFQNGKDENPEDIPSDSPNIINYSFDLLFDRGNQKALLSPMIPIFSNPQTYNIIEADNPIIKSDGSLNTSVAERLLSTFDINSSTMRRYTEANGTVVFVENDAILKLSPNGVLEFSATGADNGIKLAEPTASEYTNICMAADFMDNVNSEISANKNLYLSSDLTDDNINLSDIELNFDYSAYGLPVNLSVENYNHAVSMTISNGRLQKYTQVLRAYSNTGEKAETSAFIDSLDETIRQYEYISGQIYVDKIYAAYSDDGTIGKKSASWKVILG